MNTRRWLAITSALALGAVGAPVVSTLTAGAVSAAPPECKGVRATVVGTSGSDRLVATSGRDVVVGRGGNDTIITLGGNDVVCGGKGSDTLDGGSGADKLFGGKDQLVSSREVYTVGDRLRGGPGADQYVGGVDHRPADYRLPDRILLGTAEQAISFDSVSGTITGQGGDTVASQAWGVTGSPFDDVIAGGPRADVLAGGRGDDHLMGRGGSDQLNDDADHGVGADTLSGGSGPDFLDAGRGRDILRGGPGTDDLNSFMPNADKLFGGDGTDFLYDFVVGDVFEHLDGGPGFNDISVELPELPDGQIPDPEGTIDLASGEATLSTGTQSVAFVLARANRLGLAHGRWTVSGTNGADEILAWGRTRLDASTLDGDDYVQGGVRNDNLDGGDGTDTVWPGGGVDTCVGFEVQSQACELP